MQTTGNRPVASTPPPNSILPFQPGAPSAYESLTPVKNRPTLEPDWSEPLRLEVSGPELDRVAGVLLGHPPYLFAADRGFWSHANKRAASSAGVKGCIPAVGKPSAQQPAEQHQGWSPRRVSRCITCAMPMLTLVDPRTNPDVPVTKPIARTTQDPAELAELRLLCRDNRLYDVERCIQAQRPLQLSCSTAPGLRHVASPLEIALKAGNHALTLLLLCNGYDPNLERHSPLNLALRARRLDLIELLLKWGAEPGRVNLSDLFDTYDSQLFERFNALGVDLTAGHELAAALAYQTRNKPLFGYVRRHRESDPRVQMELNIALAHHAGHGNEKGVMLCLWAGADAHVPTPSLDHPNWVDDDDSDDDSDRFLGFSATHQACLRNYSEILERLGPDPSTDDFDDLYRAAASGSVIRVLARRAFPKNVGAVIGSQISSMLPPFGRTQSLDIIRNLFECGARWNTTFDCDLAHVRRGLLKMTDAMFIDMVKLLTKRDYCSDAILQRLGRTPTMLARMRKVGFIPSPARHMHSNDQPLPTRWREVLSRFGIKIPKQLLNSDARSK